MNGRAKDPIGAAVAAAEAAPELRMHRFNITISSTGRPALVLIPEDSTDAEILELTGYLLTQGRAIIRSKDGPRLVVASGPLPRPT